MKRFVKEKSRLKSGCTVLLNDGSYYVKINKKLVLVDLSKTRSYEDLEESEINIIFKANGKAIEENYVKEK